MLNEKSRILNESYSILIRGWHYQHMRYQQTLKDYGITQSMSRKGNCPDNAVMENFFGIMKSELLYLQKFSDIDDFKKIIKKIHY